MNINRPFLAALAILPFLEILLLTRLIGQFGLLLTLGLLLITAVLGMSIIREQGMSALIRSQQSLARGELPTRDVVDNGIAVLGGVLLIIPGVLSDLLALPCLIPAIRTRLTERLIARRFSGPQGGEPVRETVIEGEFRRED